MHIMSALFTELAEFCLFAAVHLRSLRLHAAATRGQHRSSSSALTAALLVISSPVV